MRQKVIFFLFVALFLAAYSTLFAQTKTYETWKSEFDDNLYNETPYTYGKAGLGTHTASAEIMAAYKSHAAGDMYYEGPTVIMGLVFAWQASGDFKYLDMALDIAQADVDGNPVLSYYQGDANSFFNQTSDPLGVNGQGMASQPRSGDFFKNWPYKGSIMHSNFWEFQGLCSQGGCWAGSDGLSWVDYMNNAPEPSNQNTRQFAYGGMVSSGNNGEPGGHLSLQENIYWRNIANMIRIMYNNKDNGTWYTATSNNGQTYQARLEYIRDYIIVNIWDKWNDLTYDSKNKQNNVYRVNTHMSSHLAMVALGLYEVTQEQKYLDFVQEFIWDFGSNPDSPDRIADGVGFVDQLRVENDGNGDMYVWANSWGSTGGYTDLGHAFAEIQLLIAYYEEGYATPAGETFDIDVDFFNKVIQMIKDRIFRSPYTCADGQNEPQLNNFFNATGFQVSFNSSAAYLAQFDPVILCYLEANDHYTTKSELGNKGVAMYLAKYLGVGGAGAPVYPTTGTGGGTAPTNNTPNVTLVGDAIVTLNQGDTYTEEGATWTDFEDGSGTISTATTGTVDTSTLGTYNLTYTYTDAGGLSDTVTRQVQVQQVASNNCPTLTPARTSPFSLNLGTAYVEQGATWSDIEDGNGSANVSITGTVDVNTAGDYNIEYSFTDSGGCTVVSNLVVRVVDGSVIATDVYFDVPTIYFTTIGLDTFLPAIVFVPSDVTIDGFDLESLDTEVAQALGGIENTITPNRDGYLKIRVSTIDGTNLEDTQPIEIIVKQTRRNRAAVIIMQ